MTDKTRVISVRLPNEIAEKVEKGEKTAREILTEHFEGKGEKKTTKPEGVNTALKEIESMAIYFGMKTDELIGGILDGLMNGNLMIVDKRVVGVPKIELERFYDACHDRGLDPQETLDKATANLKKGK